MDGWNTSFLLRWTIFRGYVSFRECIFGKAFLILGITEPYDYALHILWGICARMQAPRFAQFVLWTVFFMVRFIFTIPKGLDHVLLITVLVWATIFQSLHIHISYSMHIFHISIRFTHHLHNIFKTRCAENLQASQLWQLEAFVGARVPSCNGAPFRFFRCAGSAAKSLGVPHIPTQVWMRNDVIWMCPGGREKFGSEISVDVVFFVVAVVGLPKLVFWSSDMANRVQSFWMNLRLFHPFECVRVGGVEVMARKCRLK